MSAPRCLVQNSGSVELYFYGELPQDERLAFEQHVAACPVCRESLDDLALIRSALAARPVVDGPPSGDWSTFMAGLDSAIAADRTGQAPAAGPDAPVSRSFVQLFAMAALLALVTISVLLAARAQPAPVEVAGVVETEPLDEGVHKGSVGERRGLAAVGQQHFERSKLVLLGLASKDAAHTPSDDWLYERELASRLLDDTRLYRLAAEQHGLSTMASVMSDLEFVLLQTSMTDGHDASELSQIQRAIQKRDLLQKMDVVRTAGI